MLLLAHSLGHKQKYLVNCVLAYEPYTEQPIPQWPFFPHEHEHGMNYVCELKHQYIILLLKSYQYDNFFC